MLEPHLHCFSVFSFSKDDFKLQLPVLKVEYGLLEDAMHGTPFEQLKFTIQVTTLGLQDHLFLRQDGVVVLPLEKVKILFRRYEV